MQSALTKRNIACLKGLSRENRRISIEAIAGNDVRTEIVHCIVHKLDYTKFCGQWVPRLLFLQHLTEYSQNGNSFLL